MPGSRSGRLAAAGAACGAAKKLAAAMALFSALSSVSARLGGGEVETTSIAPPEGRASASAVANFDGREASGGAPAVSAGPVADVASTLEASEAASMSSDVRGSPSGNPELLTTNGAAQSLPLLANMTAASLAAFGEAGSEGLMGFEYLATTTRYGNTCCASCGNMNTADLVKGTDYYAVASAEAMQYSFPKGSCCWCGESGPSCGRSSGTAPMGCTACAKGRFVRKTPRRSTWVPEDDPIFSQDVNIVVADICPHSDNARWCPKKPGDVNDVGSKNHFDFASPPPGYDNFFFAFTPTPCSSEIQERLGQMSQCGK